MRGIIGVLIPANHSAAAFRGQVKFLATMSDIFANEFFTPPVVIGCIYEIDAFIEYSIQNGFGLPIRDRTAAPNARTADFHCSKTQPGDNQPGPAQNGSG
jgi:hypothetical protein